MKCRQGGWFRVVSRAESLPALNDGPAGNGFWTEAVVSQYLFARLDSSSRCLMFLQQSKMSLILSQRKALTALQSVLHVLFAFLLTL